MIKHTLHQLNRDIDHILYLLTSLHLGSCNRKLQDLHDIFFTGRIRIVCCLFIYGRKI